MIFNGTDWTTVISVAAGAAVTISSLWKKIEQKDPKLAQEVPHALKTVLDDGEKIVADLLKSPWFASEAAKGKLELHHITDKLKNAVVAQYAAQGLAAFDTELKDLSNIQRASLLSFVQSRLKTIGVNVTPNEVNAALELVQTAIDATRSTVVKSAAELDQALKGTENKEEQPAS